MISDFHLHTHFSGDSEADVDKVIEKAILLGMKSICITDHNDFDIPFLKDKSFVLDADTYLAEVGAYAEKYRDQINVLTGIECGLQSHLTEENKNLISSYPFDFVIGSIHIVNRQDPYYPDFFEGRDDETAFREYFEAMLENVRLYADFDVLGHIDYVVRYAPSKDKHYSYSAFAEIIDEVLKIIISRGAGIEVNTSGFANGLSYPNPCADIVRRYRELGGEIITVGSDAHTPADVGRYFDIMPDYLKSCGFNYYTVFKNRKAEFIKI